MLSLSAQTAAPQLRLVNQKDHFNGDKNSCSQSDEPSSAAAADEKGPKDGTQICSEVGGAIASSSVKRELSHSARRLGSKSSRSEKIQGKDGSGGGYNNRITEKDIANSNANQKNKLEHRSSSFVSSTYYDLLHTFKMFIKSIINTIYVICKVVHK